MSDALISILSIIIFFGFIYLIVKLIVKSAKNRKQKKTLKKPIYQSPLKSVHKQIPLSTYGGDQYFEVDQDAKEFAVKGKIHKFQDLIDFEYIEDGETIITGRSLQTVAGGLAFGGVGAIVGASGKRKEKKKIKSADIVMHINDLQTPTQKIHFMKGDVVHGQHLIEDIIGTLHYIKNNQ